MRQDEIGRERDNRILDPNFAHTRPGGVNSEKSSKKIQKIKNKFEALFLAKTGLDRMRQAKKREKNFRPEFRSNSTPGRKFRKKQQKNLKN